VCESELVDRKTSRIWIGAILALLVLLYVLVVIWSEHQRATRVEALNREQPVEENRVFHPAGFSIIKPRNWLDRVYSLPEETPLNKIAVFASRGRYTDMYHVRRIPVDLVDQDDQRSLLRELLSATLSELEPKEVVFQNRPAIQRLGLHKGAGFEDPAYSYGAIHFLRGGMWYEIRFTLMGTFSETPPGLWRFFETFRIEDS
jgi:hypothetical protein